MDSLAFEWAKMGGSRLGRWKCEMLGNSMMPYGLVKLHKTSL